jgi:hypothetical protein
MTATATKAQTLATIDATVLAAQDVRVLDIIESHLQGMLDKNIEAFHLKLIDDLVLGIQAYLKDQSLKVQGELRTIAAQAKLEGVFVVVQIIKNSPEFQELVAAYTPDELLAVSSQPSAKPEVVATGTTAQQLLATVTDVPQDKLDAHKPAKKSTKAQKPTKVASKLPMPAIASLEALEAMSRKELIEAFKALKSNNPDITLRSNAASVELKRQLCGLVLFQNYIEPTKASKTPKAAKGSKSKPTNVRKLTEVIDLPEGFCWDECKNMKYRQLQQVCKALRSQGLFQGNIGGKGATTANLLKGCADYFRSQGVDIVEVELKSQAPKADLNLPNWGAYAEQKRLERETTAALKLSNEDAKVALELAVAA